ncbi:hypothetical protein JST97_03165 [bacterium]|nr:hypothetical protein [bacterium]
MSELDLGDQIEGFELLSEMPGAGQWRVLELATGRDEWLLVRGPEAGTGALESIAQAEKTLSYLQHPGLLKPRKFLLHQDRIYWVTPLPASLRLSDYLQLHAPVLPKLISWLIELCSLLEECHQAPRPIFWGHGRLSSLRIQDGRVQVLGPGLDGGLNLSFNNGDEHGLDVRGDVKAVADLLGEMLRRGGSLARDGYRRHSALRKLVVAATSADPSRRPASLASLKLQLEKLPRPKPPTTLRIGRWQFVFERYQLYGVPLSLAGCLVCALLAAGLAQPPATPPRRQPHQLKRRTYKPSQLNAPRVIRDLNPPAPPTPRPPESS